MDLAAIHNFESELSARGSQNVDANKRTSTVFPIKIFRMRSSILTELLKVSHIRSIRQIFIAILVIVVLQVAITDLFELGT